MDEKALYAQLTHLVTVTEMIAVNTKRIADALEAQPKPYQWDLEGSLKTLLEMIAANDHYDDLQRIVTEQLREDFSATRQKEE